MIPRSSLFARLLVLLSAFAFLPLMLPDSLSAGAEAGRPEASGSDIAISDALPGLCHTVLFQEEQSLYRNVRISCSNGTRRHIEPKSLFFLCGHPQSLISAYIRASAVMLHGGSTTFSRRYIIKYIHDQDGHKVLPFVLLP